MLNITITPHREFLPADAAEQKLFLMLKVRPTKEVSGSRPPTTFAFVIDTSGSMYEVLVGHSDRADDELGKPKGGLSKIDIVIESLLQLVRSGRLDERDQIALIQFDDTASTLIGLTPANQVKQLEDAIVQLRKFSGGTRMGLGMRHALDILSRQDMTSRQTLIFTDGATFDEDQCQELAKQFAIHNIPITALGVGDYREDILIKLGDTTGGFVYHVDPDKADAVSIDKLPETIFHEFDKAQKNVITNLSLSLKTVKGVKLSRIMRVYPGQAEFSLAQEPYPMGNAVANDETVFILEFTVESRPATRVRIAQLGLTYDVPGQNRRGELPPQNLVVEFVPGQGGATQVDQEVMDYVQQCNIVQLVHQATQVADQDPQQAEELLETARRMTVRLGNNELADSLNGAQEELRKTRKISAGTRKTVKMGAKGKTVRISGDINDELSEDRIRELSGT
jgi:Ca-activated chloride channel homolog